VLLLKESAIRLVEARGRWEFPLKAYKTEAGANAGAKAAPSDAKVAQNTIFLDNFMRPVAPKVVLSPSISPPGFFRVAPKQLYPF
jgi:hypothetical protein